MKKVTSILLAIIMLFSVCTVCASAAVSSDAVMGISIVPTASSYNPGDTVKFEVVYETTSILGKVGHPYSMYIAYDSSVFEPCDDVAAMPSLDGETSVVFTGYALEGKISLANSFIAPDTNLTAADTAKGWDAAMRIAITADGDTLFDASTPTKAFAFNLKVKADAAGGTYAVGISDGSIQNGKTEILEEIGPISGPSGAAMEFETAKVFDLTDASVVVEGAGGTTPPPPAEPTITVENIATQVKWQDKDAGTMLVAFRGNIKGYTPEVTAGELTSLKEIGVYFSTTDSTPTAEEGATVVPAWTIYDFTTGGYFYRAVVGNYDYQNTTTLYANAYIKLANDTIITATNGVTSTTGAAEYTRATTLAGMEAK